MNWFTTQYIGLWFGSWFSKNVAGAKLSSVMYLPIKRAWEFIYHNNFWPCYSATVPRGKVSLVYSSEEWPLLSTVEYLVQSFSFHIDNNANCAHTFLDCHHNMEFNLMDFDGTCIHAIWWDCRTGKRKHGPVWCGECVKEYVCTKSKTRKVMLQDAEWYCVWFDLN